MRTWQRRLWAIGLLLGLAATPSLVPGLTAATGAIAWAGNGLVGRWKYQDQVQRVTYVFLPDGRYYAASNVGGESASASGRYQFSGDTLTLQPAKGSSVQYQVSFDGDQMTVSSDMMAAAMVFTLEPGSDQSVVNDTHDTESAKEKEDDEWRARLAVGPLGKQPRHVPAGEVPADPRVGQIFPKPTVFKKTNLYVWYSSQTYVSPTRPDLGAQRASTRWYFLPTGRVYALAVNTSPSGPKSRGTWGRYTVDRGEMVQITTDAGEQIEMKLIDGRRNMVWDDTTYGQIDWENEALRRQRGQ